MAIKSIEYFKSTWIDGFTVTEEDMEDWIDSFRHVSQAVPLGDTSGLEAILANYRLKSEKVPVGEVEGLAAYLLLLLENYLTTASEIPQSQVTGLEDALADAVSQSELADAIENALDGITSGEDGITPHIGENGNWWIGEVDQGVSAVAGPTYKIAYPGDIAGHINGVNTTFSISEAYVPGSTRVFCGGVRLCKGEAYDYVEETATSIVLSEPPHPGEILIIEYIKQP